jgi:hypothetical protein
MTEVVDCVERMIQFKQRNPGVEFDLSPYLFTAHVPGNAVACQLRTNAGWRAGGA